MTPEQALSVLEQMAARAMATRDDHALAQQAVTVLRDAIPQAADGQAPP